MIFVRDSGPSYPHFEVFFIQVDTYCITSKFYRHGRGCERTCKWIKNDITRIGGSPDNSFKKSFWFLRRMIFIFIHFEANPIKFPYVTWNLLSIIWLRRIFPIVNQFSFRSCFFLYKNIIIIKPELFNEAHP